MRTRFSPAIVAGVLFALVSAGPVQATAATIGATAYYLALGDSLARGVQPDASGVDVETNQGYVDDLYTLYRAAIPGLQLVKLGCPDETTTTMIHGGGRCNYPLGSQLAQAVDFLKTHRVVLVTIDIGANNVDQCIDSNGTDPSCLESGFRAAQAELPDILAQLRAARPDVLIVGMNYYDPFLAVWLQGPPGQALATASEQLTVAFNGLLGSVYSAFGVPVADVQSAFQTTNFTSVPPFGVPVNVILVCSWTWMCAPDPVGPNIHPNVVGYWVIAGSFAKVIGPLRR